MKKNILNCFVQARITSKRFPNKILSKINNKTVLEILLRKLKKIKKINKTIVLIPDNKKNDKLAHILKKLRFDYFRGNEKNVLDRYYKAYKTYLPKNIIRITADCPLIDISILKMIIEKFLDKKNKYDYISNTLNPTFPDGLDVEIFKSSALVKAWKYATDSYSKEHVTPFIKNNKKFKKLNLFNKINQKNIRLTLDWKDDLKLIKKIFNYYQPNIFFGLKEINKLVLKYPKWFKINLKYNVR